MFVWAQEQEVELQQKQERELGGKEQGPKLVDTLQSSLFNDFC